MSEKYPEPGYAASIWLANGLIHLGMDGHTVRFEPRGEWHKVLLAVLQERDREARPSQIGFKASPVQYSIDGMLKHIKRSGPLKRDIPLELFEGDDFDG